MRITQSTTMVQLKHTHPKFVIHSIQVGAITTITLFSVRAYSELHITI